MGRLWYLLSVLLLISACAGAQTTGTAADAPKAHPLTGSIWLPATKQASDWSDLKNRISDARFVLAGEKHDNPEHHQIQARLVRLMADAGRKPALVWEMITESKRATLKQFLEAPGATAAGQGAALNWAESGWPAWKHYQPIAAAAFSKDLRQYPGNLDRSTIRGVAREGYEALKDVTARSLVQHAAWTSEDEISLSKDLIEGHCGFMPDGMLKPMGRVQRSRDAVMAAALLEADLGDGAILIAGNGHVRADRGVPRYLAPESRVLSIGLIEIVEGEVNPADYLSHPAEFDVVIFTSRVDTPDRCEALKKRFGKKKKSG